VWSLLNGMELEVRHAAARWTPAEAVKTVIRVQASAEQVFEDVTDKALVVGEKVLGRQ